MSNQPELSGYLLGFVPTQSPSRSVSSRTPRPDPEPHAFVAHPAPQASTRVVVSHVSRPRRPAAPARPSVIPTHQPSPVAVREQPQTPGKHGGVSAWVRQGGNAAFHAAVGSGGVSAMLNAIGANLMGVSEADGPLAPKVAGPAFVYGQVP